MSKIVSIIGAGFSGLSAACYLAKAGYTVTILEKNETIGGRARKFEADGFVFDMGPSWYWMPDVFESFFNDFGKKTSDYYKLTRLDPSYKVILPDNQYLDVPSGKEALKNVFEGIEPGSAKNLDSFLASAKYKYEIGMKEFVYKPGLSILEFIDIRILKSLRKLRLFSSITKEIDLLFKSSTIKKILEFPVLFLGAKPQNTPALYSLMNYADIELGTWYPEKGMYSIIEAMKSLALELGVYIKTDQEVKIVDVEKKNIIRLHTQRNYFYADAVLVTCDYEHFDQNILQKQYRNYSGEYWDSRTLAPSSLIFYLGVKNKIPGLLHHNLFFDESFEQHAQEIYDQPTWPKKPLFYVCCPSKSDETVAPEGSENLFILIPIAPDLSDGECIREEYFNKIMDRLEKHTATDIRKDIVYKRSYGSTDFIMDYHSFKGNAYGLANTLRQTALLKPRIKSRKINNLFYAGQFTVPGPGVPPSLISGKLAAGLINKYFSKM